MRTRQEIRRNIKLGSVLVLTSATILVVATITLPQSSPPLLEGNPPNQDTSVIESDPRTLINLGLMFSPILLIIGGIYLGIAGDQWLTNKAKS